MPYTIAKFFIWALGFALVGLVVGWLLRSIRCARELAAARSTTVDVAEHERMRNRVASLEPIVQDRDELRQRVSELEAELRSARAAASTAAATAAAPAAATAAVLDDATAAAPAAAAPDDAAASADATVRGFAGIPSSAVAPPDLDAAKAVLGKTVALDDLKIVEGIGPVLEGVLHAGGISTWSKLARTDADTVKSILVRADDRHRMHDTTTWPRQAELAASGQWQELLELQQRLTAGRD